MVFWLESLQCKEVGSGSGRKNVNPHNNRTHFRYQKIDLDISVAPFPYTEKHFRLGLLYDVVAGTVN